MRSTSHGASYQIILPGVINQILRCAQDSFWREKRQKLPAVNVNSELSSFRLGFRVTDLYSSHWTHAQGSLPPLGSGHSPPEGLGSWVKDNLESP